ncbi:hypothetical protein [Nonomuraea sp. SYSU D8015]|uniref:hypothetical protein n=1 Tax=Nonomuraea sp. SYSU D8015 TaxID=2593644 RepID=UPI001660F4C9|nr:hypothetical protein [Nonomuraea sp. SYSU D8015]
MNDPATNDPLLPGNYVRSLVWPDHVGTVTAVDEDGDLFVTWHGHMPNDQISPDKVIKLTDEEKAAYIAAWQSEDDARIHTVCDEVTPDWLEWKASHPDVFAQEGGAA